MLKNSAHVLASEDARKPTKLRLLHEGFTPFRNNIDNVSPTQAGFDYAVDDLQTGLCVDIHGARERLGVRVPETGQG